MKLYVSRGRGYRPAASADAEDQTIVSKLDASFSPCIEVYLRSSGGQGGATNRF